MKSQSNRFAAIPLLLSVFGYISLAYFTARTQTYPLFLLFGLVFGCYLWLLKFQLSFKQGILLAFVFRLLFLFAYPRLSDDYFRFIWDGTLFSHGQNPFLHLPAYYANQNLLENFGLNYTLFTKLNSPHYFSVYPPVSQYIFAFAGSLTGDNILLNCIVMRLVILAAELGTILLLKKIIAYLGLPQTRIWWYALNPLIILEFTGNLHFEALLLFFLAGSLYFLFQGRQKFSAIFMGLAVCVKLVPLMLLPLFIRYLGWQKFIKYAGVTGITIVLLFIPFLSEALFQNLFSSLDLYFQKFEFNASFYYVLRWAGFKVSGYNEIARIGPFLSLITLASILWLSRFQKEKNAYILLMHILFAFTLYLSFATIVHPWYVTSLVMFGLLTNWKYPLVWSGMVFLSYGAYGNATYKENYWFVFIEYAAVFATLVWELKNRKEQNYLSD